MSVAQLLSPPEAPVAGASWMDLAACKGHTPLFFPPKAERPQARERREARAGRLCIACPVLSSPCWTPWTRASAPPTFRLLPLACAPAAFAPEHAGHRCVRPT